MKDGDTLFAVVGQTQVSGLGSALGWGFRVKGLGFRGLGV